MKRCIIEQSRRGKLLWGEVKRWKKAAGFDLTCLDFFVLMWWSAFLVFFFIKGWLKKVFSLFHGNLHQEFYHLKRKERQFLSSISMPRTSSYQLCANVDGKKAHLINENQSRNRREQPCITNEDAGLFGFFTGVQMKQ